MTAVRLILVRHGNTFAAHDTPVWVGAQSDLPLVDKGLEQARAIGAAFQKRHIIPKEVFASTLKRTYETAFIICEMLRIHADKICIDPRLTEIDYGQWEGKSNEAIRAAGMGRDLEAWSEKGIFPEHAAWHPTYDELMRHISRFLEERTRGTSLVVTSNGILRFFALACHNAQDYAQTKVATGHMCIVRGHERSWTIEDWNKAPSDLRL